VYLQKTELKREQLLENKYRYSLFAKWLMKISWTEHQSNYDGFGNGGREQ